MIEKDISRYAKFFTGYTELRRQENRNIRIGFVNGNLLSNIASEKKGTSARVYRGGSWGFASSPNIDEKAIEEVIKEAGRNSSFLDSKLRKSKGALPASRVSADNSFFTSKPRKTQKEIVEFMAGIDAYVAKNCPKAKGRKIFLNSLEMEKSFVNSDGSVFYSMVPQTIMYVDLTAEKDGSPVDLHDVFGTRGQFEDVFEKPTDVFEKIDGLYSHLMKKAEGVFPETGKKECVLAADLAGILAHEAIGHTTEADLVLGGSVAANLMNKEVGSSLVSITDFANSAFGETCPVPVYADDEGTRAQDARIIENGVLKSYLHSKETAVRFGVGPTGNARAYEFSDEPIVRMRNTAILPGESKVEEMIRSVKDGYYLMKSSNGQADATSEFMFGIVQGYEIKSGKLGRAIKDTTISGVAFDVLKTVSMVSDDMRWSCGGMCGKKQLIPVGLGGAAVKCEINIGGR